MQNNINKILSSCWSVPIEQIITTFNVNTQNGLTVKQVQEYRTQFGMNALEKNKATSIGTLLLEGLKEPMIILLLGIASLSLLFGKLTEAFAMIFVVIAYILVEFINKYRSDRVMAKLKSLVSPTARVLRDGNEYQIPTEDIVVGDILILSEGALIPADGRLLTSFGIIINEASLTGESLPVSKKAMAAVAVNAPLAERISAVFSGTTVLSGEGKAIVMAVGKNSEFGKIAQEVGKAKKEQTILQQLMTRLAKALAFFAIIMSALIPAVGFIKGLGFQEMVLTWLALTFLMIPGQPPIIITMALALAAFELARKKVIVKRLRGAEIIGQTTIIISDKTGTITESTMKVEKFILADGKATPTLHSDMQELVALAIPMYSNDPTDRAVIHSLQLHPKATLKLIDFIGFSGKQFWRALTYTNNEKLLYALAGSPELIIASSKLSLKVKKELEEQAKNEALLGKRIVAYAIYENEKIEKLPNDLQFVALAILHDPVRMGVKEAIATLENAGIPTIIVTGDHAITAQAIAKEIGIAGNIITGDQLEKTNDAQLLSMLKSQSRIFARTDPLQKLRLVQLLQSQGEIVAVIGDGINDAPALKRAQVGIAMGQIGTDLAKEVSDLILTDDNYVHLPDAVAIGRKALYNFKKGLTYYLSAKSILIIVFLIPIALGMPFPFTPIQIICIELLMDLASSTIFVTEPAEPDIMKGPATDIRHFISFPLILRILANSIGLAIGISFLYVHMYKTYGIVLAQTAAFVSWLLGHILLALNLKQEKTPLIIQGLFSNYFALLWLVGMLLFSLVITSVPFLYVYLNTTWLPLIVWLEIGCMVLVATCWIEVRKIIKLFGH